MSRKTAREEAMKILYEMEITKSNPDEILNNYFENLEKPIGDEERKYITEAVNGVSGKKAEIDSYISKYLKGWNISRIAKVDLAIMRIAVYEMMDRKDVPGAVAVNEAVEIAKKYSDNNSPSYINGVLANVMKEIAN